MRGWRRWNLVAVVLAAAMTAGAARVEATPPVIEAGTLEFTSVPTQSVHPILGVTLTSWSHQLIATGTGFDVEEDFVAVEAAWSRKPSDTATYGDWMSMQAQFMSPQPSQFLTSGTAIQLELTPIPSEEAVVSVRVRAADSSGPGPWTTLPSTYVDLVPPRGLDSSWITTSGLGTVGVEWQPAVDPNFQSYQVGALSQTAVYPSSATWHIFGSVEFPVLATIATTAFSCQGFVPGSSVSLIVIASDSFHNQTLGGVLSGESTHLFRDFEADSWTLYPRPNAYRHVKPSAFQLSYELTGPATVWASIRSGRDEALVLKQFPPQALGPGAQSLVWDGRTDEGLLVDEGVYALELEGTLPNGLSVKSPRLGLKLCY
ncbi:MAG: hypothetical protein HY816_11455 [Candidatus Wallbacteria bacterium]|nr:hypothetical protein [Candidatus Wallbacteria bacterium]